MFRVLCISTTVAIAASLALALSTPTHRAPELSRSVGDAAVDDDDGRAPRPKWENAPAVAATFLKDSYRPGSVATLVLWRPESRVTMRIYRSGPERSVTRGNITMHGLPVTRSVTLGRRAAHAPIRVSVGEWPSGLYFAKLTAPDGVGFAPFVVRPRRLGEHRVLVVLPTYTWQAYNFRDDDGDGKGDTWYANWSRHTASLARPFLARGVPPHFYRYDLPFLQWLARTHRAVDLFADSDLGSVGTGDELAAAYDLIVFPGHHEYVTTHEYDVVERYRDLGGNLMFLSANNFFWKVTLRGNTMTRVAQWRDLGRPESALVGVQFIGTDGGYHRGPWLVRDASPDWPFAGTGLSKGAEFGDAGIEIDHTTASSPRGLRVLAELPHLFGARFTAQMTYYETETGAKVFAAGAFSVATSAFDPTIARLLANLWQRLAHDTGV
jgi:N,N-dimethylformamidase beta subunit-like, C-terminal